MPATASANVYECLFMLDTTKLGGDIAAVDKMIRTMLEKHKAEVLVSRPWDERRLAYQIGHQKKALYYLVYFSAPSGGLLGFDQDCKLNEAIIRKMTLKIHPKLVETMLSVAKGEHAVALHNYHDEPGEEVGGAPGGDDRRGRRGEGR